MAPVVIYQSHLVLEDFDGYEMFRLVEDFSVQVDDLLLTAQAGMLTDGASIPRFFWRFIGSPLMGKYRRAVIIHDAGYGRSLLVQQVGHPEPVHPYPCKRWHDGMLKRLSLHDGVSRWRAGMMHVALKVGGGKAWRSGGVDILGK